MRDSPVDVASTAWSRCPWPRAVRSGLLAVGLLAGCGQARDARERMRALGPHLDLRRPDGPGPLPAALLVPGCRGFRPKEGSAHHETVTQQLRARGYVVARVDYLAARGMRGCQGGSVETRDIGLDVLAVAAHLRTAPDVRTTSVVAIGESLGGGGDQRGARSLRRLEARVRPRDPDRRDRTAAAGRGEEAVRKKKPAAAKPASGGKEPELARGKLAATSDLLASHLLEWCLLPDATPADRVSATAFANLPTMTPQSDAELTKAHVVALPQGRVLFLTTSLPDAAAKEIAARG